ncbi:MAG TPA: hypothetical protein VGM37_08540 [Armatimonadota bacterium]|jgi:hypothetical protein
MDLQSVVAIAIVVAAAAYALRHVWAEVRGLIDPKKAGCPGCGECDAAKAERAVPTARVERLVTLQAHRPAHLRPPAPPPPTDPAE